MVVYKTTAVLLSHTGIFGGELGTRTLNSFRYNAFQERPTTNYHNSPNGGAWGNRTLINWLQVNYSPIKLMPLEEAAGVEPALLECQLSVLSIKLRLHKSRAYRQVIYLHKQDWWVPVQYVNGSLSSNDYCIIHLAHHH